MQRQRVRVAALALLASACHSLSRGAPTLQDVGSPLGSMSAPRAAAPPASPLSQAELPTTDGALALANIDAEIAGLKSALAKQSTLERLSSLAEDLDARGQFLGKLADYEDAAALADAAVASNPRDGRAYGMRAKSRAVYHRFADATADLDQAQALGVDPKLLRGQRAALLQAVGKYDAALTIRHALSDEKRELSALGNEASVLAEMGETERAERLFIEAEHHYRDVSPFPLAWLWFQEGVMWERLGKPTRARALFGAACARVPGYAHAASHLASLETPPRALALLQPIASGADDPEYEAALAVLLRDQGEGAEAEKLLADARQKYDRLTASHPEAFADHAARFWLGAGADDAKALLWARKNADLRSTELALTLLVDAAVANHDHATACTAGKRVQALPRSSSALHLLAARAFDACGRDEQSEKERQLASAAR